IGLTIDINRSFQAGEYVFAQTTFGGSWGQISGSGTDQIIYDVWRFEDGFAVEHWDNIGDVIDDMDGTTQTDGVTTPAVDLDSTATNQALLEEMAQTLFINGDWTNVRDYFDVDNYIQHSVGAGTDGAFLASLEGQTGVSFYEDIKFVHTSGNFGLIMSQGPDITGQDTSGTYAYYDLFRIENGLIIEHWDIIELIPPQNEWVNNNGKWGDDAIKTAFSGRTEIALRNTLQDPGQPEVTYTSLFNQADDAFDEFALLSNTEIEFATALAQDTSATGLPFNINGLYEIDFTETSIDFRLLPDSSDTFWIQQFGVFPAGKFDRYYFTLSESHNISAFSSNNSSVSLRIDSDSVVVVEISEGYDFNPGISFSISLRSEDQLTNEDKAIALNAALVSGDSTALQYVSDDQYIQHNLFIPDGKAGIAGFYTGQNIGITVDLHRSFEIGDFVVNHTTFGGSWGTIGGSGSDQVVFDVWRFEEGLMVEHWDNITNVVDDMDGTSQTDGAVTPATDLDSTAANQALLEEMAEILFVGGDWTNVRSYFDIDNYIQHSVGAGTDGSFLASLEGQTGVSFYDEVKFIHTLGNFGLVMSQGPDITGQDSIGTYAYYDLFRIENGLIVEHWDVIQLIPPQSQWANSNGKWGNEALSIENLLAETGSIRLAPNPFTQSTNFEIQLEKGGLFQLQVFDITGKEVSRKLMRLNTGVNSFTYHANHLPSGLYSYRLSNNQGFISGKMIVK
ncbi:MAG: nuclear transport factor 2 family protein, partial [Bacteroidota bacterium]